MIYRVHALAILLAILVFGSCCGSDEARAEVMCQKANAIEKKNPRAALALMRQMHEEMPTAGTSAAKACLQPIRKRMGEVRVLISEDETGETAAIEGCDWVADAMEVFAGSVNPPFRRRWAKRLMERCAVVVGRAWTRNPDSQTLMRLNKRLKKLSEADP
jgi:hypothetical protein